MNNISWEDLIAQFVPHPGHGPNSIYTRINLCGKQIWSFIAWLSLQYCTHSAKLALTKAIASLQQSTHKAKWTLYWRFCSLCFTFICACSVK